MRSGVCTLNDKFPYTFSRISPVDLWMLHIGIVTIVYEESESNSKNKSRT